MLVVQQNPGLTWSYTISNNALATTGAGTGGSVLKVYHTELDSTSSSRRIGAGGGYQRTRGRRYYWNETFTQCTKTCAGGSFVCLFWC